MWKTAVNTHLCPINDLFSDSVINLFESCKIDFIEIQKMRQFTKPTCKLDSKLSRKNLFGAA